MEGQRRNPIGSLPRTADNRAPLGFSSVPWLRCCIPCANRPVPTGGLWTVVSLAHRIKPAHGGKPGCHWSASSTFTLLGIRQPLSGLVRITQTGADKVCLGRRGPLVDSLTRRAAIGIPPVLLSFFLFAGPGPVPVEVVRRLGLFAASLSVRILLTTHLTAPLKFSICR